MKITEKEVRYVANLANLDLKPDEIDRMVHDLDSILEHMDRLAEINTDGVEPMSQVVFYSDSRGADAGETATLRPDAERAPLGNDAALGNAPLPGQGYFKVPKVIER